MATPAPVVANDRDVFGISFAMEAIKGLGNSRVAVVTPGSPGGADVSCTIARHLANSGHDTIVTDFPADAAAARVMIGSTALPGLFDVMAGKSSLRDVLYLDHASPAHILAPGNTEDPAVDISRLPQVIAALDGNYDFRIFECGNSGMHGVSKIADRDTIIIVSVNSGNFMECRVLEQALKSAGYSETLMVRMDTAIGNSQVNAA